MITISVTQNNYQSAADKQILYVACAQASPELIYYKEASEFLKTNLWLFQHKIPKKNWLAPKKTTTNFQKKHIQLWVMY